MPSTLHPCIRYTYSTYWVLFILKVHFRFSRLNATLCPKDNHSRDLNFKWHLNKHSKSALQNIQALWEICHFLGHLTFDIIKIIFINHVFIDYYNNLAHRKWKECHTILGKFYKNFINCIIGIINKYVVIKKK